jgi:23S rRNA 5-hydroxycytidine C2501 synthase
VNKTFIELLSPARDLACGIAAIEHGADAVYIGAPKFGARAAVGNSLEDIRKLIDYAHQYYVKVYATVNTILYDNELEDARNIITKLDAAGIDAIIVQDMSILEMDLPPVPIFASTQTHNFKPEKIKFLADTGVQRIILARELSNEQIKKIHSQTDVDLEFFVHGALCVCYSGQCYLSAETTGRSANRGECSQPCRMEYSLIGKDGQVLVKDKYLLSLKDLNLSDHLFELIRSGITSFKIEGRLKDISYVKNITAYYRKKLDAIIDGDENLRRSSSGRVSLSFEPDPDKTFNRGYTEHFFDDTESKHSSMDTQKAIGKYVGTVSSIHMQYFEIKAEEKIVNGDGLCFFDKENELRGMLVNKIEANKIYCENMDGLKAGIKIYRNKDKNFIKELSAPSVKRKIQASIGAWIDNGKILITASDEDSIAVQIEVRLDAESAADVQKNSEMLEKQFKKSGDSIFTVTDVYLEEIQNYFFPISKINEFRREILRRLLEKRINSYERKTAAISKSDVPYPDKKLDYRANVVNAKSLEFYKRHGVEITESGFEILGNTGGRILMTTKYCIKNELDVCPLNEKNVPPGYEKLYLHDGKNKFRLTFDCAKCEMHVLKD